MRWIVSVPFDAYFTYGRWFVRPVAPYVRELTTCVGSDQVAPRSSDDATVGLYSMPRNHRNRRGSPCPSPVSKNGLLYVMSSSRVSSCSSSQSESASPTCVRQYID